MVLRLILVSLVASMGFDAPTSQELETWNRSGRDWVASRAADLSSMANWQTLADVDDVPSDLVEAEEAPGKAEVDVAVVAPVDDLTFEIVVEGMAVRFGDELEMARKSSERVATEQLAVAESRPIEAPMPVYGKEPIVEDVTAIVPIAEVAAPSTPVAEVEPIVESEVDASRMTRLTNAVRLTRRAVAAWASLIDAPEMAGTVDDVVLTR